MQCFLNILLLSLLFLELSFTFFIGNNLIFSIFLKVKEDFLSVLSIRFIFSILFVLFAKFNFFRSLNFIFDIKKEF